MENPKNQTALITGASSGIGYELTRCFARDHYHVVMVAHDHAKLKGAARNIEQEFPEAEVSIYACDLSKPGTPDEIFNNLQRNHIQVDVLVNNAGVGEHGIFSGSSLQRQLAIIQLNIASLVHLTHLYLPQMLERNAGRILQLGSVVSFMPNPLMAVYAATKAFVLSFTEALQNEIRDSNVTMTVLCPPATDTNFFREAGAEHTKVAQKDLASAEEVAVGGYEAQMKGEARTLPTLEAQFYVAQSNMMPDSVLAAAMRMQMEEANK